MRLSRDPATQDWNLDRFVGREAEIDAFRNRMSGVDSSERSVTVFHGVGGVGKTWLLLKLQRLASELGVPTARLDYDRQSGGSNAGDDFPWALFSIRTQLGVSCPRFELAYTWLRYKRGQGQRPEFKGEGGLAKLAIVVEKLVESALQLAPSATVRFFSPAGVYAARQLLEPAYIAVRNQPVFTELLEAVGLDDYVSLAQQHDQAIEASLVTTFCEDLRHAPRAGSRLTRLGAADPPRYCIFIDGFESFQAGSESSIQQSFSDAWVRQLCEHSGDMAQVVIGSQESLRWEEVDPEWKHYIASHELTGLTTAQAHAYLRARGVTNDVSLNSIVNTADPRNGHHPLWLGWAADAALANPNASLNLTISQGDWRALARRFMRAIPNDAMRRGIESLSLLPQFDEKAARHAFGGGRSRHQDLAWENLMRLSIVVRIAAGWWTIRDVVRRAITEQADPQFVRDERGQWSEYWWPRDGLEHAPVDDSSFVYWYLAYQTDPVAARFFFLNLFVRARDHGQSRAHRQLCDWPRFVNLRVPPQDPEETRMVRAWAEALISNADWRDRDAARHAIQLMRALEPVLTLEADPFDHMIFCVDRLAAALAWPDEVSDDFRRGAIAGATAALEAALGMNSATMTEVVNRSAGSSRQLGQQTFDPESARASVQDVIGRLRLNLAHAGLSAPGATTHPEGALGLGFVNEDASVASEQLFLHLKQLRAKGLSSAELKAEAAALENKVEAAVLAQTPKQAAFLFRTMGHFHTDVIAVATHESLPPLTILQTLLEAISWFERATEAANTTESPFLWVPAILDLVRAVAALNASCADIFVGQEGLDERILWDNLLAKWNGIGDSKTRELLHQEFTTEIERIRNFVGERGIYLAALDVNGKTA